MLSRQHNFYQQLFQLVDAVLIAISLWVAHAIRFLVLNDMSWLEGHQLAPQFANCYWMIALALPVGLYLQRRWWPGSSLALFCDALVPALIAGWALGRVLGPQFMVNGGGHLTHQWFGIHYAGQVGKRVPVPLIQGAEDSLLWLALLTVEHLRLNRRVGVLSGVAMIIWGLVRSLDERLLLGQESHSGSLGVQIAGIVLALGGAVLIVHQLRVGRSTPDRLVDPHAPATP